MTEIITPTVATIDPTFSDPFPAMQQTVDAMNTLVLTFTGGIILAVFVFYWLFEIIYIVLDKRRRRYS